jgi:hypothetical protein
MGADTSLGLRHAESYRVERPKNIRLDQDSYAGREHSHRDTIPFFGLMSPHITNSARNANPGPIQAHRIFGRFAVTALIGVFLKACFRITD